MGTKNQYITNQKQIRELFWQYYPDLDRMRIPDYSGKGSMYCTDTRCAFTDFLDYLRRSNQISVGLASRATL